MNVFIDSTKFHIENIDISIHNEGHFNVETNDNTLCRLNANRKQNNGKII